MTEVAQVSLVEVAVLVMVRGTEEPYDLLPSGEEALAKAIDAVLLAPTERRQPLLDLAGLAWTLANERGAPTVSKKIFALLATPRVLAVVPELGSPESREQAGRRATARLGQDVERTAPKYGSQAPEGAVALSTMYRPSKLA